MTDSPRPVPSPTSFVVKNGSKMRARVASSMPMPVSRTSIASHCGACSPTYGGGACSTTRVTISTVPPSGDRLDRVDDEVRQHLVELAFIGLDAQAVVGAGGTQRDVRLARDRRDQLAHARRQLATLTGAFVSGRGRAKSSSWRISAVMRSACSTTMRAESTASWPSTS